MSIDPQPLGSESKKEILDWLAQQPPETLNRLSDNLKGEFIRK